ncbi:MAG TPA: ABC transporter substrate-binding protein [Alphaproteobacteria bacterium]
MTDHAKPNGADRGRRIFIQGAGAAAATATFGLAAPAVLAQSRAPLKLGLINSFSKAIALAGTGTLNGMNLYLDETGGTLGGRKVDLLREDDEFTPQVGLQKLRKFVESDKCDLVCGIQASNVMLACLDYLKQSKQFFLCTGAGVAQLSYVHIPYFFRSSVSTWQSHTPFGEWFCDNIAKECVLSAMDYAGGRDTVGEFKLGFVKKGGKIVKEIFTPVGTGDYSPYLADIRSLAPPASYHFYVGPEASRFIRQYTELGLRAKIKLATSGFMIDDALPAAGKDAIGILSSSHYADTLDNPTNKKFTAAYAAKYKEPATQYAEYGYVAAQVLDHALKTVDGNAQDRDKLREAMLKVKFEAPRGPFSFNPDTQNPILDVYIREAVEIDGRIGSKILKTLPQIREPKEKPF